MRRRLLLLLLLLSAVVAVLAKKVRIPDDLRDVEDNEEDEEWKNWGKQKPKPRRRSKMDINDGKLPTAKELGRAGFAGVQTVKVNLKKATMKSMDDVRVLGTKWSSLLYTGGIRDNVRNVYAIDETTIVVQLNEAAETLMAVKKFLFADPYVDSMEIKGVKLEPDPDDDDDNDDDDDDDGVKAVAWASVPRGGKGNGAGGVKKADAGGAAAAGAGVGAKVKKETAGDKPNVKKEEGSKPTTKDDL